ncbi:MAG: GMC family oxidoreductase [Aphanocapsa lilacina HA4352-LM1]|jgi:choline dehydrogenase-like flavoprotein|nr:GMC family oxidoreductase [Aphanocapsa lilacina HA4352-LM1]
MHNDFDVVIIGSGAGGAPVAHTLAQAGKAVLVIEKGPLFRPQYQSPNGLSDFKRDELFATGPEKRIRVPGVSNWGESYYSSHVEPDLNDEPHIYQGEDGRDRATIEGYTAQVVGGGTQLYGGVSLRYCPIDFCLGSFNAERTDLQDDPAGDIRREARDWPITYADLEPYYGRAERLIGINGTRSGQAKPFGGDYYQRPLPPNAISDYVKTGLDALGLASYRTPLAVITEDHAPSGRCVPAESEVAKSGFINRYGDPLGLKSNTWVSLLTPVSRLENFALWTNCVVTHLGCAPGGRIDRLFYRDPSGAARRLDLKPGAVVVVACSAIESVRLLALSALEGAEFDRRIHHNDLLGAYFLTHCLGGAEAIMHRRCDKSRSLDSDWATDACQSEAFLHQTGLWAGGVIYNNTSDQALPLSLARTHGSQDLDTIWRAFEGDTRLLGEPLIDFLDQSFGTLLSVCFMANQVPLKSNRIALHPSARDKWNRPAAYIIKQWHPHDIAAMNLLAEQCARILRFGADPVHGRHPIEGQGGVHLAPNARARIANHILGGARFGADPADSVLDPTCRAWQFDNLYVTDGSFMPTSGGANPTLTIQANAFRIADHLLARI